MVNMDNIPGIHVLLNDFVLPFSLDLESEYSAKFPLFLPDRTFDSHLIREWSVSHGIPLIFLPPQSADLNPFGLIWPRLLKSLSNVPIFSKQKLWEEVADWFDLSSRYKGLWYVASRSMYHRLVKVYESNGNIISY